jgi:hypothetical protein
MEFLLGAHLDNRQPPQSSYDRLRLMRAEAAVALYTPETHHDSGVYRALRDLGVRRVCVRVGDEQLVAPADWLRWANAAYAAVRGVFPDDAVDVQVLNEVNLSGAAPEALAAFVAAVRAGWSLPCRLLLTPLSMGRLGWQDYLARLLAAFGSDLPFDAVAVHPYAGNASQIGPFLAVGKPVVVTEFGHPGLSGAARAAWSLAQCQGWADQGVESACQFIVDGVPFGAWDPNYRMTDDEARALGARRSIVVGGVPSTKHPWEGKVMVVRSNAVASWDDVIAVGHALGFGTLDLQCGNGAGSWVGSHVTPEIVARLRAEGFRVTGWVYDYDDLRGPRFYPRDGVPEAEAANAIGIVRALGLDGWTSDLEIEAEGHGDLVAIHLDGIRRGVEIDGERVDGLGPDFPLAAFVWADLHGHERYPVDVIAQLVDVVRPMCYEPVWNAEAMYASLGPHLFGRPLCPVWGVTEATPAQLAADFATADAHHATGESYWEHAALIARQAELAALIRPRFAPPAARPLTAAFDRLWDTSIKRAARGEAAEAIEDQEAIVVLKTALADELAAEGGDGGA